MRLIPKNHTIPKLYSTETIQDPICHLKLFTPDANWTWYLTEIDEENELCFGYVVGLEKELGYFAMSELGSIRGALGLPIERDLGFTPTPLSQIKRMHND
jgi:hypothetical protein